jgi:hypothetical protein
LIPTSGQKLSWRTSGRTCDPALPRLHLKPQKMDATRLFFKEKLNGGSELQGRMEDELEK